MESLLLLLAQVTALEYAADLTTVAVPTQQAIKVTFNLRYWSYGVPYHIAEHAFVSQADINKAASDAQADPMGFACASLEGRVRTKLENDGLLAPTFKDGITACDPNEVSSHE